MKKIVTGALAALTLGGTVLGGASAASARDWDHHDHTGAAVAAGIAGLAIGAALASGDHGYYAPAPAYYYGPAPAYYSGPVAYSYYRHCRVEWRWNGRWGRYERVRACY
jgi:hypothetical protein